MAFPNFKNKHLNDSVFTPEEFWAYQKKRGKYPKFKMPLGVIFCYSNRLLKYILKNHKNKKAEGFQRGFYLLSENKIGVMGEFGIGAPISCALLEELIALGVKKFVSIGEAGALQKKIKIGSIVVCDKAIRDEGTSHHYIKPSKYAYASKNLTGKIKEILNKNNRKYIVGTSWTIDAPYRETVAEAKKYQKEGVATVEMEASALFSVAQFRKADIGAIFTVSDSLAELKWKPKFHLSDKNWKILFETAKEALLVAE